MSDGRGLDPIYAMIREELALVMKKDHEFEVAGIAARVFKRCRKNKRIAPLAELCGLWGTEDLTRRVLRQYNPTPLEELEQDLEAGVDLFPDLQEFYPVKRSGRHVYVRRSLLSEQERAQLVALYRRLANKYNRKADALEAETLGPEAEAA